MVKRISIVFALISFMFFSSTARGEVLVKYYKMHKQTDLTQIYVDGLGTAFEWANIAMKRETGKSLFCVPENLALVKDNFIRILDDEIKRREKSVGFEKTQEEWIEPLLLFGLQTTFPRK